MPDNSIPMRPGGRGFTLIELLVVVSIIAILGALLFPVINMARQASLKAKCLSNVRQLGMVLVSYSDLNHGLVPLTYEYGTKQSSYWFCNSEGVWHDAGMIYNEGLVESPQAFYCPLNTRTKHTFDSPKNPWPPKDDGTKTRLGYAFRPMTNIDGSSVLSGPLPMLENLTRQVVAADICDRPAKMLEQGHGDGISALWGDGHVSLIPYSRFKTEIDAIPPTKQSSANNAKIDALWAAFDASLE